MCSLHLPWEAHHAYFNAVLLYSLPKDGASEGCCEGLTIQKPQLLQGFFHNAFFLVHWWNPAENPHVQMACPQLTSFIYLQESCSSSHSGLVSSQLWQLPKCQVRHQCGVKGYVSHSCLLQLAQIAGEVPWAMVTCWFQLLALQVSPTSAPPVLLHIVLLSPPPAGFTGSLWPWMEETFPITRVQLPTVLGCLEIFQHCSGGFSGRGVPTAMQLLQNLWEHQWHMCHRCAFCMNSPSSMWGWLHLGYITASVCIPLVLVLTHASNADCYIA